MFYWHKHLAWSIFCPSATDSDLDSMGLCLHPQSKYNEFHTIKTEDFPQMAVVSLTPECQLRNILMSFLTLGWSLGLFFPFRHHIKPLSFSGLYCWDCFANSLSMHQEERAISTTKTCDERLYRDLLVAFLDVCVPRDSTWLSSDSYLYGSLKRALNLR